VHRLFRVLTAAAVAFALNVDAGPMPAAAAIGPYTYPFYTNRTMTSDYGPSDSEVYSPGHGYPHWHGGIDWSMPIGTDIAASRTGTVRNQKEDLADGEIGPYGTGNYVYVEHTSTRFSLYYHLTKNGVVFPSGTAVSAGEHIADAGNTGVSSGPHLHYALMTSGTCQSNTCDVDPNQWTTSPGRVPYRASFSSESHPGTVYIYVGDTVTYWVKFKNTGGRTWVTSNDTLGNGRIVLQPVQSNGTTPINSQFAATDWELASSVGTMDQATVGPDATATFTFGLKGNVAGTYTANYFNLRAVGLAPFNHAAIDNFSIPITVWEDCTPCP
jgi:murein DD-endopeptidase MepM/ murein hydrolase activator NlpD